MKIFIAVIGVIILAAPAFSGSGFSISPKPVVMEHRASGVAPVYKDRYQNKTGSLRHRIPSRAHKKKERYHPSKGYPKYGKPHYYKKRHYPYIKVYRYAAPRRPRIESDYSNLGIKYELADQLSRIETGILENDRYKIKRGAVILADISTQLKEQGLSVESFGDTSDGTYRNFVRLMRSWSKDLVGAAPHASMSRITVIRNRISATCVQCHEKNR